MEFHNYAMHFNYVNNQFKIEAQEVRKTIIMFKYRKASGIDYLLNKVIKYG